MVNGGAWCWGANRDGELGDGSTIDRPYPVPVKDLSSGVVAITAGSGHSCALTNAGAKCWGGNSWGQLGNSSLTEYYSPTPVLVEGL